jgi:hypothetical protein
MADRKISALSAIVTIDDADLLTIVDVSEGAPADQNKKMTMSQLAPYLLTGLTDNKLLFINSSDFGAASIYYDAATGRLKMGGAVSEVSALLDLSSTSGALLLSRMTTTQKNALTAVNGMVLYDATLTKLQGYENGAWVNFRETSAGADGTIQESNGAGAFKVSTIVDDGSILTYTGRKWVATATANAATGNEVAYSLVGTVNKATSGNFTLLSMNVTDTASPDTITYISIYKNGVTPILSINETELLYTNATGVTFSFNTSGFDANVNSSNSCESTLHNNGSGDVYLEIGQNHATLGDPYLQFEGNTRRWGTGIDKSSSQNLFINTSIAPDSASPSSGTLFVFGSSGYFGIGNTPSAWIHIIHSSVSMDRFIAMENNATNGWRVDFRNWVDGTTAKLTLIKNSTSAPLMTWEDNGVNGAITIGGTTSQSGYELTVNNDIYAVGDVSALTFTDRTPYPESLELAYDSILSLSGKRGKVIHEKLHSFIKSNKDNGRNLSALVSAQNEVIKDLIKRIKQLEL